jgi:hypothetical protein
MLANTLHNKSQKKKGKKKKEKLKTTHTILLPNPGKLITYSNNKKATTTSTQVRIPSSPDTLLHSENAKSAYYGK